MKSIFQYIFNIVIFTFFVNTPPIKTTVNTPKRTVRLYNNIFLLFIKKINGNIGYLLAAFTKRI